MARPRETAVTIARSPVRSLGFLRTTSPLLADYAQDAVRLPRSRPADALVNARKFAEYLALHVAHEEGIEFELDAEGNRKDSFLDLIGLLRAKGVLADPTVIAAIDTLRRNGNLGAHSPRRPLSGAEIGAYKNSLQDKAVGQVGDLQTIVQWFRQTRYCRLTFWQRILASLRLI